MIPYWPQPVWMLGPWTFHAFGVAQATALILGYVLALRRARRVGLDVHRTGRLFVLAVIVGLATGLLIQRATSEAPGATPGESAAGLTAGALMVAVAARMTYGPSVLPHLDALASVAPLLGAVARFGCFLAHDHKGRPSTGLFAVRFPEGPRLDLGLLECAIAFATAGPVWYLWRSRPAPGLVTAVVAAAAVGVRFVASYLA